MAGQRDEAGRGGEVPQSRGAGGCDVTPEEIRSALGGGESDDKLRTIRAKVLSCAPWDAAKNPNVLRRTVDDVVDLRVADFVADAILVGSVFQAEWHIFRRMEGRIRDASCAKRLRNPPAGE